MSFVISGLYLLFSLLVFFLFRHLLSERRKALKAEVATLQREDHQFSAHKGESERRISSLNLVLAKTFKMYEAAREICRALDEEKLLSKFKEDLKKVINYQECLFLPEGDKIPDVDSQSVLFPLAVKEGHLGYLLVRGAVVQDHPYVGILAGQLALGVRRARLYKMVQELAITDSLTGLYTRRYANERLNEEFKRSQVHKLNLSVLMIDVDDFKDCNDRFGHLVGDIVLCEIGNRIQANIREVDMLSRFGGEEFLVFTPNTSRESALSMAERIRRGVQQECIRAYDEKVQMTISIGVSSYPEDGKGPEDLVSKADWALYQAKKSGKNKVCAFGVFYE